MIHNHRSGRRCAPAPGDPLRLEPLEERSLLATGGAAALSSLAVDAQAHAPDRILVRFAEEPRKALPGTALAESLSLVDGLYTIELKRGTTMEAALAAYRADRRVLYAEPDYEVTLAARTPNDPRFGSLWGMDHAGQGRQHAAADINAPEAWSVTTGSGQLIVAVIDTGVDYTHPDLAANIWINHDEIPGNGIDDDGNGYIDDVYGWDFANNDNDPRDDHGHGTHVAGTIGAVGDNGIGVAGVNWNVQLMPLKFLNSNNRGYISNAISALNYAVANGAAISNHSWITSHYDLALSHAIQSAREAGHIVVAAAGNDGANNDHRGSYPAGFDHDNIVSVAAVASNNRLASFSNYGAYSVDIAAPGVGILSTLPGARYGIYQGTSMATPHVTGTLALVRDLHPDWSYRQVIDQVLGTADTVPTLQGKVQTGGRLNAAAAVGNVQVAGTGPRVIAAQPLEESAGTVSALRLTFSETIKASTFTAADVVSFVGPSGSISVTQVASVPAAQGKQFDLLFPTQAVAGLYKLTLGTNLENTQGVRLNQNGNSVPGETPQDQYVASFTVTPLSTFVWNGGPQPIQDLQTNTYSLIVDRNFKIGDLKVRLDLTHGYVGDLHITLRSPRGTSVLLFNRRGGSGDHLSNVTFEDETARSVLGSPAPYSGTYRPERPLSSFIGEKAQGTWQLTIDDRSYGTAGTLNSWSLIAAEGSTASKGKGKFVEDQLFALIGERRRKLHWVG